MRNIFIPSSVYFAGWGGSKTKYNEIKKAQSTYSWEEVTNFPTKEEVYTDITVYKCSVCGRVAHKLLDLELLLDPKPDDKGRHCFITENIDNYNIRDILT